MAFKKLSDEQITKIFTSLQSADIIFVEAHNIVGGLISWGTGDNDNFNPCHVFQYVGEGVGKTIEADGKAINWHLIEEYRKSLKSGEQRMIVYRLKNLTVDKLELIKKAWKEDLGKKYNWWVISCFAVWGLVRRFTPFGGLFGMIKNPAYTSNSMVCSQQVIQSLRYVDEYYKMITADKPVSNMTPEEACDRVPRIANQEIDSNYTDMIK